MYLPPCCVFHSSIFCRLLFIMDMGNVSTLLHRYPAYSHLDLKYGKYEMCDIVEAPYLIVWGFYVHH